MPNSICWPLTAAALTQSAHADRFPLQPMLRADVVMAIPNLPRSTAKPWVQLGRFPTWVKLPLKTRAWHHADIEHWLVSRTADGAKEGA